MDELTEERIARNDAAFRSANERVEQVALSKDFDGRIPFICECADRSCTEIVFLSVAEYEHVREDSRHFFNVPGHQVAAQNVGEVVETHDTYLIYEKQGHAGDVTVKLDERRSDDEQLERAGTG